MLKQKKKKKKKKKQVTSESQDSENKRSTQHLTHNPCVYSVELRSKMYRDVIHHSLVVK